MNNNRIWDVKVQSEVSVENKSVKLALSGSE